MKCIQFWDEMRTAFYAHEGTIYQNMYAVVKDAAPLK